jgi:hypothetical protein
LCQQHPEQETATFNSGYYIYLNTGKAFSQGLRDFCTKCSIFKDWRNVFENDAWLWEISYISNGVFNFGLDYI